MKPRNSIRVLHSAALLRPPSGILTQMQWEQDAAVELGLTWQVKMYCPSNSTSSTVSNFDGEIDSKNLNTPLRKLMAWIRLRFNYYHWLMEQQDQIDVFLLRYYVHDPFQWLFIIKSKRPVFLVHHTLEVPELAMGGNLAALFRASLEKLLGLLTLPRATGLIGVTDEIVQYEKKRARLVDVPSYVYPNGIIYKISTLTDRRDNETPELLFIANFAPWHGLDILLKALAQDEKQCILHLVGVIPDELLSLTKDVRIKVHGALNHEQIASLSQQCWIGLSSFALRRKGMKHACPLKVREYLMLGLPVYGDYTDIFPPNANFFRTGTESINDICRFAVETRKLLKTEVSDASKKWIDKKDLLRNLEIFVKNVIESNLAPADVETSSDCRAHMP